MTPQDEETRKVQEALAKAKLEEDQRREAREAVAANIGQALDHGAYDGRAMTIARATVARVNTYLRDIALFLRILQYRGDYKTRRGVRMTDAELDEYTAFMTREVTTLAIDAVVFDAFLLMQDEKARRRGWLERLLARGRAPLYEQYGRFSGAIKRSIYVASGPSGPYPRVPDKQEVPDNEARGRGAAAPSGAEAVQGVGDAAVPDGEPGAGDGAAGPAPGRGDPGGGGGDGAPAQG